MQTVGIWHYQENHKSIKGDENVKYLETCKYPEKPHGYSSYNVIYRVWLHWQLNIIM